MQNLKTLPLKNKTARNPAYLKIGKRIKQARVMAGETNSRELGLRLGWSAGRIHNYESGLSTPGIEETLQFCEALKVDPAWVTYGVGAPRPPDPQTSRYRKFMQVLDNAEKDGVLPEYLATIKLPIERMQKFRSKPHAKIPDVMARRCEKYLKKSRGWIDEPVDDPGSLVYLTDDMQELLTLYARLKPGERTKFIAIGRLLAG